MTYGYFSAIRVSLVKVQGVVLLMGEFGRVVALEAFRQPLHDGFGRFGQGALAVFAVPLCIYSVVLDCGFVGFDDRCRVSLGGSERRVDLFALLHVEFIGRRPAGILRLLHDAELARAHLEGLASVLALPSLLRCQPCHQFLECHKRGLCIFKKCGKSRDLVL